MKINNPLGETVGAVRPKMYKSGKQWVVAGTFTLAALGVASASQVAHADDTTTSNTASVSSSENINVDHSALNQAVNDAKSTGVNVSQGATTQQNVGTADSANAKATAEANEKQQAQTIAQTTEQQRLNNKAFDNTTADVNTALAAGNAAKQKADSNLDSAVSNAQNAGVNVTVNTKDSTPSYGKVDNTNADTLNKSVSDNITKYQSAINTAVNNENNDATSLSTAIQQAQANQQKVANDQAQVQAAQKDLDSATSQATSDGVTVRKSKTITATDLASALQAVQDQKQKLQDAVAAHNQAVAANAAQNAQIQQQNAQIDADNAAKKAAYDQALAQYNADYQTYQAAVDKSNALLASSTPVTSGDKTIYNVSSRPNELSSGIFDNNSPIGKGVRASGIRATNSLTVTPIQGSQVGTQASVNPYWSSSNTVPSTTPVYSANNGDEYIIGGMEYQDQNGNWQPFQLDYKINNLKSNGKGSPTIEFVPSQLVGNGDDRGAHSLSIFLSHSLGVDYNAGYQDGSGQSLNLKTMITWNDIDIYQGMHESQSNIGIIKYSPDISYQDGIMYSTSETDLNGNETDNGQYIGVGYGNNANGQFYNPYQGGQNSDVPSTNYDNFRYDLFGQNTKITTVEPPVKPTEPTYTPDVPTNNDVPSGDVDISDVALDETPEPVSATVTKENVGDVPASIKPADLTASYNLHNIVATPTAPSKTVTLDGNDINNKSVTKGDTIQYTLTSDDMAADRSDDITSAQHIDTLDSKLNFTGYHAYLKNADGTQTDVTKDVTLKQDGQKLTFTDGANILAKYNADKTKQTPFTTITIDAVANSDGSSFDNTYQHIINGKTDTSNTVRNTSIDFTPHKQDVDNLGKDNNGTTIEQGDNLHYILTWDMSQFSSNTAISSAQKAKGLSFYDQYDPQFVPTKDSLSIMSADGKTNLTDLVNQTWDDANHKVTVTAKDVDAFLKATQGTQPKINLVGQATKDAKGEISNTAWQNNFGDVKQTETVVNKLVPLNPHKALIAEIGNPKEYSNIGLNSSFIYKLDSSTRPANIGQTTTQWSLTDKFDTTHDTYLGTAPVYNTTSFVDANGKTVAANTDLQTYFGDKYNDYFATTYDDGTHTLTVSAKQAYLDLINTDQNRSTEQGFTAYANMKRIAAGDVTNVITEKYNNRENNSNIVPSHTPNNFQPHKQGVDDLGKDNNGKSIEQGDNLHYIIDWDNSDLSTDQLLSKDVKAKGVSLTDNYDPQFVPTKDSLAIFAPDGKTDITKEFKVTWDDQAHTVSMTPTNLDEYIAKYGTKHLKVNLYGKATDDAKDEIKNTAYQNQFGQTKQTETIVNKIPVVAPHKDVVTSESDKTSINNGNVELNAEFNYELSTHVRPANIGTKTTQWSVEDKFDTAHDQYTGNTAIENSKDFVDADGKTVKAGTNLNNYFGDKFNNYFDIAYDNSNGTLKVSAKQAYLDLMNSDENRKTEQAWTAFPTMKRIAAGDVSNVITEHYNNRKTQSNTVVTHTKEPVPPVTPTTTPVSTPVSTPETGKQAQTNEGALVALALAGTLAAAGLAVRGRRKAS